MPGRPASAGTPVRQESLLTPTECAKMRGMRRPWLAVSLLAVAACDLGREAIETDGPPLTDALPPPNGDLVPPVGSDTTLDVACWNLEWFPKDDVRSVALSADLITSLELDLIVVEEVASIAAWDELVARLPHHEGLLSTHRYSPTEYQKIGFLYRPELLTAGEPELLFTDDSFGWPRPAMKVHFETMFGLGFDAIGLHLKAGGSESDAERRAVAMVRLDQYIRAQVDGGGEDELLVLGDYNEVLTNTNGQAVLAPMLSASDRYTFRTAAAAAAGEGSFVPNNRLIDHIVTTAGISAEVGPTSVIIPRLDAMMQRYDSYVSDHLPVVLSIPMP
jgi:endonuclease/exonuclease/phosphatase family metal-dependent hydrolase